MHDLRERWSRLWSTLGATGPSEPAFDRLVAAYSEPHRAYHNLDHVRTCLEELDRAEFLAEKAMEIELAIWLHDAVYDPKAKDNEIKCAELAAELMASVKMTHARPPAVRDLILATMHNGGETTGDGRLMADIDLSILGQRTQVFDKYEEAIRKEYEWVPEDTYRVERSKVLRGFLQRPHVYHTAMFRGRYESTAKSNLERAIQRWKKH